MSLKKDIDQDYYKGHPAPAGLTPPSFKLPAIFQNLQFSIPQLCASISRCSNASHATSHILKAQAKAAEEFIKLFVCPTSPKFVVLNDAGSLIDAKLVGLSHDIGAGIAHLCMDEMKYSWRASGAEVLPGKKKKPDYIYDNGCSQNEVVAMESKGSVSKYVTKNKVMERAEKGYAEQLSPWLGQFTKHGSRIAHGYAIGTWAPLGKSVSEIGVHETTWPGSNQAVEAKRSYSTLSLDKGVALSNYAEAFELIGSSVLSSELRSINMYQKFWLDEYQTEEFLEVFVLGMPFLVSIPRYRFLLKRPSIDFQLLDVPDVRSYLYSPTFAISLDIAKEITGAIQGSGQERIKISSINEGIIKDITGSGDVAMFRDGLALLPPGYIKPGDKGRVFQWSQRRGLIPISHF